MPEKTAPASGVVYYVEDDKSIRELTVYALRQEIGRASCRERV